MRARIPAAHALVIDAIFFVASVLSLVAVVADVAGLRHSGNWKSEGLIALTLTATAGHACCKTHSIPPKTSSARS